MLFTVLVNLFDTAPNSALAVDIFLIALSIVPIAVCASLCEAIFIRVSAPAPVAV